MTLICFLCSVQSRHATVSVDAMLEALQRSAPEEVFIEWTLVHILSEDQRSGTDKIFDFVAVVVTGRGQVGRRG